MDVDAFLSQEIIIPVEKITIDKSSFVKISPIKATHVQFLIDKGKIVKFVLTMEDGEIVGFEVFLRLFAISFVRD